MIKKTIYFGNPAYLSLRNGQLLLSNPDTHREILRSVPVEELGFVVLDNQQITITQGLLEALTANKCAILNCGRNHIPSALMLPMSGNTLYGERIRFQVSASKPLLKQLWQQTVRMKIMNQAIALRRITNEVHGNMIEWSKSVRSGDGTNLEARAATYYWKNIFGNAFIRGRFEGKENNFLNYGYSLLRAVIARSLVCSGLSISLGINHHNKYNTFPLADDIMEPYRPYVDLIVVDLLGKYGPVEDLSTEIKKELLQIPVMDVSIKGKRSPLMVAASLTSASLVKCFAKQTDRIIYPIMQ